MKMPFLKRKRRRRRRPHPEEILDLYVLRMNRERGRLEHERSKIKRIYEV